MPAASTSNMHNLIYSFPVQSYLKVSVLLCAFEHICQRVHNRILDKVIPPVCRPLHLCTSPAVPESTELVVVTKLSTGSSMAPGAMNS